MTNDHNRPPCNIVICSDGTGNAGGRTNGSNVWRIRQAVAESTQPRYGQKARPQIVIYEDGVGSEAATLPRVIGGAFGWGMTRDIKSLYGRLIREFQPGDQIYLFGFSRGAFTARTLANLLHICGIADCWHEVEDKKTRTVVRQRRTPEQIDAIVDKAVELYKKRHKHKHECDRFRQTFGRGWPESMRIEGVSERGRFPIRFVGMWDTVDALGLPFDNTTQALANKGIRGFRLNLQRRGRCWLDWEDDLHPEIQNAFHAVSIDDERQTFHPVLWLENEPASEGGRQVLRPKNQSDYVFGGKRKVEQVWFAGVHANVGGGYPKDQQAHVSLCWMMRHAARDGLAFDEQKWQEFEQQRDELGRLYDSRAGAGAFYRYKPRPIAELSERAGIGVPVADVDPQGERTRPPLIHSSVFNRIHLSTRGYAPTGIPVEGQYEQVGDPAQKTISGSPCARPVSLRAGAAVSFAEASWPVSDCEVKERTGKRCQNCTNEVSEDNDPWPLRSVIQQEVFDLVALRRVLFYLLYAFVIGVIGLAFYLEGSPPGRSSFVPAASRCIWWSLGALFVAFLWKWFSRPISKMDPDCNDNVQVTACHLIGRLVFQLIVVVTLLILFETTAGEILVTVAPDIAEDEVRAITSRSLVFMLVTLGLLLLLGGTQANRHGIRELNVFGWQLALGQQATKPRRSWWLSVAKKRRSHAMRWLGSLIERIVVPTVALGLVGLGLGTILYNEFSAIELKSIVDYVNSGDPADDNEAPQDDCAEEELEKPEDEQASDDREEQAELDDVHAVAGLKSWTLKFQTKKILGTGVNLEQGHRYVISLTPMPETGNDEDGREEEGDDEDGEEEELEKREERASDDEETDEAIESDEEAEEEEEPEDDGGEEEERTEHEREDGGKEEEAEEQDLKADEKGNHLESGFGWKDASHPAGPEGLTGKPSRVMNWFSFMKRDPDQKYFQMLATIGSPLEDPFVVKNGVPFTAMTSGELFLFVNDVPWFYDNNCGSALVTITMEPGVSPREPGEDQPESRETD